MKKIKIINLHRLLAMSSCVVATNCTNCSGNKPITNQDDKVGHAVFVQTKPEYIRYPNPIKKGIDIFGGGIGNTGFESHILSAVQNGNLPIDRKNITIQDVIRALDNTIDVLNTFDKNGFENSYSKILYTYAWICSFERFGCDENSVIKLYNYSDEVKYKTDTIKRLTSIANYENDDKSLLKTLENLQGKSDDEKWKKSIFYGEVKKFFFNLTEAIFSKIKSNPSINLDSASPNDINTEIACFLYNLNQEKINLEKVINLCVKNIDDQKFKYSHKVYKKNHFEKKGKKINWDFKEFHDSLIKEEIALNENRKIKVNFGGYKNDDIKKIHFNSALVENTENLTQLSKEYDELKKLINLYKSSKTHIKEEDAKKFLNYVEQVLIAIIYNGIKYNIRLFSEGKLESVDKYQNLESLRKVLLEAQDYKCETLKGCLGKIFDVAIEILKNLQCIQNFVTSSSTATIDPLLKAIDEMNATIERDFDLLDLARTTFNFKEQYLNFAEDLGIRFFNKSLKILKINNKNNGADTYGYFLSTVFKDLKEWDDNNVKNLGWNCDVLEHKQENNPFLFENGGNECMQSGFDWYFNNIQEIIYDKLKYCVLPTTYLEVNNCLESASETCNKFFNKIINKMEKKEWKNNISWRAEWLCDSVFDSNKGFYSVFARIPDENKNEYCNSGNLNSVNDIISKINTLEKVVENRKKGVPRLNDAIVNTFNFVLIDNPNEVIDVCLNNCISSGDLAKYNNVCILKNNVEDLYNNLFEVNNSLLKLTGNEDIYFGGGDNFSLQKCTENNFSRKNTWDKFVPFDIKNYTSVVGKCTEIDKNLIYILHCFKILGVSIPKKFINNVNVNNYKTALEKSKDVACCIQDFIVNNFIACAKYNQGWQMTGFNDQNKLHTILNTDVYTGNLVYRPNSKKSDVLDCLEEYYNFSPFKDDVLDSELISRIWYLSYDNFTKSLTTSLTTPPDNIGWYNPLLGYVDKYIDWKNSDFGNFIVNAVFEKWENILNNSAFVEIKDGAGLKKMFYNKKGSLYVKVDNSSVKSLTNWNVLFKKLNSNCSTEELLKDLSGSYKRNGNSCLKLNEALAKHFNNNANNIDFNIFLEKLNTNNCISPYLALTSGNNNGGNFSKQYNLEFYENSGHNLDNKQICNNFKECLTKVKEHIDSYYKGFNDYIFKTNVKELLSDSKGKAILYFSLFDCNKNFNSFFHRHDLHNLIKCFISNTVDDTEVYDKLKCLRENVLKIDNEDNIKIFKDLVSSNQFGYEIGNCFSAWYVDLLNFLTAHISNKEDWFLVEKGEFGKGNQEKFLGKLADEIEDKFIVPVCEKWLEGFIDMKIGVVGDQYSLKELFDESFKENFENLIKNIKNGNDCKNDIDNFKQQWLDRIDTYKNIKQKVFENKDLYNGLDYLIQQDLIDDIENYIKNINTAYQVGVRNLENCINDIKAFSNGNDYKKIQKLFTENFDQYTEISLLKNNNKSYFDDLDHIIKSLSTDFKSDFFGETKKLYCMYKKFSGCKKVIDNSKLKDNKKDEILKKHCSFPVSASIKNVDDKNKFEADYNKFFQYLNKTDSDLKTIKFNLEIIKQNTDIGKEVDNKNENLYKIKFIADKEIVLKNNVNLLHNILDRLNDHVKLFETKSNVEKWNALNASNGIKGIDTKLKYLLCITDGNNPDKNFTLEVEDNTGKIDQTKTKSNLLDNFDSKAKNFFNNEKNLTDLL